MYRLGVRWIRPASPASPLTGFAGSSIPSSNDSVVASRTTSWSGISGFDRSPRIPSWTHAKWLKSTKFSTRRAALQCQSYCGILIFRYASSAHSGKAGSGIAGSPSSRQTQIRPACSAAR